MTKAADIIAALVARKPEPLTERHTGMPYGWGLWLRALKQRLGQINRDTSEAIIGALAGRPPAAAPAAVAAMGRWRTARSLFYQDWDPPLREERGLRWFAGGVSLFMHLLFVFLLVLFALVKAPPPPSEAEEESRVQMEFIGQGTPLEEGGGPPAAQAGGAEQNPAAAVQAPVAEPAPAASVAAAEPPPSEQVAQPAPAEATKNVQVTQTPTPTADFVLPPPTLRPPELAQPQLKPREVSVPTREVSVVEAAPAARAVPQREVTLRAPTTTVPEVRQREVAAPLPQVRTAQVPARTLEAPEVRAAGPVVRQAEIAMPSRGPAPASSSAAGNAANAATASSSAPAASTAQGTQPAASGAGAATANRPGAIPAPQRGDDWGASDRNVAGQPNGGRQGEGGPGLFNADGSVRVPDSRGGGSDRPGAPGSRQQQQALADRANKWLERPEYPYEPTMFDKYWVPNESVLAEWVRRAIREVEVPIPGTSKRVRCVVSVLQAGGACGLFDPNLNNQPATARPPPEIPVKRNPIPTDS